MMDDVTRVSTVGDLRAGDVLDTIGEGYVVYDKSWRILYMNRAALDTLRAAGGVEAGAVGSHLWTAFPALAGSSLEAHYLAAMAASAMVEFEAHSPVSGRWFGFRAYPSGRGLTVITRDITAERAALEGLRASEALVRALVHHSPEGILLTAPTGEILSANPSACRMLGRSEIDICQVGRAGVVDPADPRLDGLLEARSRAGHAEGELMLVRGDGSRFPALLRSSLFVDAVGNARSSLSFQDLTEQRRASAEQERVLAALRDSEELFRLSFEHAASGKALIALDGRFLRVNERMAEIVGYPAGELTGLRFQDITHPDDLETDLALVDALVRGDIPRYELAKRYVRKDAQVVDALLSVSLLRSKTGAPQLFIAQVQDVTEQRRIESQLVVADRMTAIGTLAGGIAHEINNPLASLLGSLELAADGGDAETVAQAIGEARAGAARIRDIVRGMQTLLGTEREQRAVIDVHTVIDAAVAVTANELRHRAELDKEYGDCPPVEADAPRLTQVLINVLVNAAEAIPEGNAAGNRILIHTGRDTRGRAIIEIQDSGRGMPGHILARAFDPFFTTKDVGAGVGLGLSIAHASVTGLGGTIEIFSEPGLGTRVRIALPAATAEAAAPTPAVPRRAVAPGRGRVLVVDDDVRVATILGRVLQRDHDTTVVYRGADAIQKLADGERYDVILCDLMMPEMTGADVYEAVLCISRAQARRMAFITGGAFTQAARAFLDRVPNRRLDKPIDAAQLRREVAEAIAAADDEAL